MYNARWHTRQFCHMHTVAATDTARRYTVEKDNLSLLIVTDLHGVYAQMRQLISH